MMRVVTSMMVVMKGPEATAGSNLSALMVNGMRIASIGAINTVIHKDNPTMKEIRSGCVVSDVFKNETTNVIPKAMHPMTNPFISPVSISLDEFLIKPFSFVLNILSVTANVCVATFPADAEIKG